MLPNHDYEWNVYYSSNGRRYVNRRTGQVVRLDPVGRRVRTVTRESVPQREDELDAKLWLAIGEAMLDA